MVFYPIDEKLHVAMPLLPPREDSDLRFAVLYAAAMFPGTDADRQLNASR
jgi:hypothetical protein